MKNGSELITKFFAGDVAAASRMITMAENRHPVWASLYDQIVKKVGRAYRVGFTGPPGVGKSTLIDACAKSFRKAKKKVGVIAVDPTSPFSGGALLGDRIRMQRVQLDEGVFIRSMGTRGSHGGMARATIDACDVLDAFGFEEILIETVGVGQAETDILSAVETVIVILCPGLGDGIQAMKAGLMEIADIFAINKADLPGAEKLRWEIHEALSLCQKRDEWKIPILETVAGEGRGISKLIEMIQRHRKYLGEGGKLEAGRRERQLARVRRAIEEGFKEMLWEEKGYGPAVDLALSGKNSPPPYALAEKILERISSKIPKADKRH